MVQRLTHQLLETHDFEKDSILIGLQPRGVFLADKIEQELLKQPELFSIQKGVVDHTFFRDDFRRGDAVLTPNNSDINLLVTGKKVVLVDDVLYTGRSVRAGIEALLTMGRPASIELLVLIDRRFLRELPIEANYTGIKVDALGDQRVLLEWDSKCDSAEVYIQ